MKIISTVHTDIDMFVYSQPTVKCTNGSSPPVNLTCLCLTPGGALTVTLDCRCPMGALALLPAPATPGPLWPSHPNRTSVPAQAEVGGCHCAGIIACCFAYARIAEYLKTLLLT